MTTDFKIKFNGDKHEIDANLLINNLVHTTTIIQEINNYLDSDKKIDIHIKATEKGSFLVHLSLVETTLESLKNLLTKDNVEIAGAIIGTLVGLIELKKFLKGKEPASTEEKGNKVKIENEKGDIIIINSLVQNIYDNNQIVNDALSYSFQALENDNSIDGYEITDKNEKPLVKVKREEFEYLAIKKETESNGIKETVISATLNILRLSFDSKLKSDFYYRGNKISAKINDTKFYEKIDKGASFSKGDTLEVEMKIKQSFDASVNTYINKGYEISKITNHIRRDEQAEMNFEE